jgi:hypothetical protein
MNVGGGPSKYTLPTCDLHSAQHTCLAISGFSDGLGSNNERLLG